MKTPAKLADGDHDELRYMAKDVQTMMKNSKVFHLWDEMNRKKICYFIDKYVTRLYGFHHIQLWAAKNQNKTIFDLIIISDLAYTFAVIENSHEIWEQSNEGQNVSSNIGQERWDRYQVKLSTKKTPRFTKRAGKKREYNTSGWNQEGIHFFDKVFDKWKTLVASENKEDPWEQFETEWNEYIEDNDPLYFYRRSRKRKLNFRTDSEKNASTPSTNTGIGDKVE
jgi:hypothetical protein